jgi:pimeloyl-ACP methyl ester carboxylesterase
VSAAGVQPAPSRYHEVVLERARDPREPGLLVQVGPNSPAPLGVEQGDITHHEPIAIGVPRGDCLHGEYCVSRPSDNLLLTSEGSVIAIDENGRGRPLVLLHGVGASRAIWRHVTPALAEDRHVIAPDLPGFGESTPANRGFELGTTASALADELAERAGEPFDLLGNSLGGAVALTLAVARPDLVRCLVLSAPAGFAPGPWALAAVAGAFGDGALAIRRVVGAPMARSSTARRGLLWGAIAEPQRLSADDALMMLGASRGSTQIGAAVATVLRSDLRSELARLEGPLGVIWGWRDQIVPITALRSIRTVRPDAVVATIPRAAHVPQVERPGEFVTAVRSVLHRLQK